MMRDAIILKILAYTLMIGSGLALGAPPIGFVFSTLFLAGIICGCASDIIRAIERSAAGSDAREVKP